MAGQSRALGRVGLGGWESIRKADLTSKTRPSVWQGVQLPNKEVCEV